jgi:flagellar motor switch/type III secretory pathway protein FliN
MNLPTPESEAPVQTEIDPWDFVQEVPCALRVEIPVEKLTVGQVLKLQVGSIINSGLEEGSVVSIWVSNQRIGWGRFEVVGERLGIQIVGLR